MWKTLGGRALAHKIAELGFYSPNMLNEAHNFIMKRERCQKHAPIARRPLEMLIYINSPIPFAIWGIDILGPIPITLGQSKFLVVTIDFFTMWIEAKPLAKITTKQIDRFFWESIICRYRITRILVTDNETKLNNKDF